MHRKSMSYADHAWLRMNDPDNLMIITGLMTFDTPVDYERLKSEIEQLPVRFERFRQRLAPPRFPFMPPAWEDDPDFDLESHIQRITLPSPADQRVLQALISLLMSKDLNYARPLWQFYLVENYAGGSALIARLHHCMADGISLMQVLLSLTEPAPDFLPPGLSQRGNLPSNESVKTFKSNSLNLGEIRPSDLWQEGRMMLRHPDHAAQRARQGLGFAKAVGKLALRWPDPQTVFKGPLGHEKRAAWSDSLDLQQVKWIGKTLQGTVNDILVTAVAGALGRYAADREQSTGDLIIRSLIPINLRPVALDEKLGNKFGLLFLSLPLGIHDPVERLHAVRQNMEQLKSSAEAVATFTILNLLGAVPPWLQDIAVAFFDTKGSSIMTNVPGPRGQLHMAGAPIDTIMAWVPQSGRISLGVSIISYNGKVWLGVATDAGLIPDPHTIISMFQTEYRELVDRAQKVQDERREPLQPMFTMLEEATRNLDELLSKSAEQ